MHSTYEQSLVIKQTQKKSQFLREWLPKLAIFIWGVTVVVAGAFLMVDHWVSLPMPSDNDAKMAQAIDDARSFDERGQWLAVHILYSKCACSQRVVDHLFSKSRNSGVKEKLIIVDGDRPEWVALVKANGFSYDVISPKELHTVYNIPAAPIMVVSDPRGKVHYAGGYTARKQGPDIKDLEIIKQVMAANPVKAIPLFGCAIAKGLQELVDPFGFKY